jgi:hypothetical protein
MREIIDQPVPKPIWETLETWEQLAKDILKKAELPTDYKKVIPYNEGTERDQGWATVLGYVGKYRQLEPEYYAANMLFHIDQLREHKEKGNIDAAIKRAMLLQQTRDNLILSDFELQIRLGQNILRTNAANRERQTAKQQKLSPREKKICSYAKRLKESKIPEHSLTGATTAHFKDKKYYPKTAKQIRAILRKGNVLPPPNKKGS